MNRHLTKTTGLIFLLLSPIAALAADEPPLSAAVGITTDTFTLIWKIGVPSGLITGALSLLGIWWSNRSAQKNNREKIAAEADNISRQLNQRQHEFEIQTKMQIKELHSDDIKRVCNDFLSCTNPLLFSKNTFDFDTMVQNISPLYMYCDENYFSYFNNLTQFIIKMRLTSFGERYAYLGKRNTFLMEMIRGFATFDDLEKIPQALKDNLQESYEELNAIAYNEEKMNEILSLYSKHYKYALDAAKKLIWGEPISEAEPLNLPELSDEDDI